MRVDTVFPPPQLLALQLQLPMQLAPFAHPQKAEETLLAPLAQLRLRRILVRGPIRVPQFQDAGEFGFAVAEFGMRGIGRGALVGRTLTRVLDAEEGRDRQHLAQAAVRVRGDEHARELHVHRQARHRPADRREPALRIDRAEFLQLLPTVGDRARIGRLDEREAFDDAGVVVGMRRRVAP